MISYFIIYIKTERLVFLKFSNFKALHYFFSYIPRNCLWFIFNLLDTVASQ